MENYRKDQFGVVHQINRENIPLPDYGKERNDYGQMSHNLSYLRLGYIQGLIQDGDSICDVGFGNGDFLRACQKKYATCAGFDLVWDYLPEGCVKETNLLDGKYYDIVTFFDSLEHFDDIDVIDQIDCNYVVISVPNCKHPDDDFWFSNWKHRKPNEHLHHFNADSLISFLIGHGYMIVDVSYIEDIIRKADYPQNILTVVAQKA